MVGAPGTLALGVTLFDAADVALLPITLVAITVHVTAVPLVNPLTVMGDAPPLLLLPPQVAVYPLMTAPPLEGDAVNAMVTCPLPAVAMPMVGAPGTVAGVTLLDVPDAAPVPTALVAVTLNVYAVPLLSPLTVSGDIEPEPVRPPGLAVAV